MRIGRERLVPFILVGALTVALPTTAAARSYRLMAKGGLLVSKLRGADDPFNVLTSVKTPTAGVAVGWPMGGSFEVQPELLYVVKGVSFGESEGADEAGNPTGTFETLHVTEAVEVPVVVRWRLPVEWVVRPVLLGGPFASFEISERLKTTGGQSDSQDSHILKNTDYGLVLGGGVEIDRGSRRWLVEARYDLGLADLGSFSGDDSVQSGALGILAGVHF